MSHLLNRCFTAGKFLQFRPLFYFNPHFWVIIVSSSNFCFFQKPIWMHFTTFSLCNLAKTLRYGKEMARDSKPTEWRPIQKRFFIFYVTLITKTRFSKKFNILTTHLSHTLKSLFWTSTPFLSRLNQNRDTKILSSRGLTSIRILKRAGRWAPAATRFIPYAPNFTFSIDTGSAILNFDIRPHLCVT